MPASLPAVLLQPLDVVKTIMQGSRGPDSSKPLGTRISTTVSEVVKSDGPSGLWRGLAPSVLRVSFGAGFYFAAVSALLGREANTAVARPSALQSFFAGATARAAAGAALLPLTVLKTRFEWGGAHRGRHALWRTARDILKNESIRGLYSGMGPTLLRDTLSSGIYLLLFDQLKAGLYRRRGGDEGAEGGQGGRVTDNAAAALAAGGLATMVTHPLDVVKTRAQLLVRSHAAATVPSTAALTRAMLAEEGWGVFLRGAAPRVAKRAVTFMLVWGVYDRVARFAGLS